MTASPSTPALAVDFSPRQRLLSLSAVISGALAVGLGIGALIPLMALLLEAIKSPERDVPDYIEADHNKMSAKLLRVPGLSEVPFPVQMEPNLVVEFYSR